MKVIHLPPNMEFPVKEMSYLQLVLFLQYKTVISIFFKRKHFYFFSGEKKHSKIELLSSQHRIGKNILEAMWPSHFTLAMEGMMMVVKMQVTCTLTSEVPMILLGSKEHTIIETHAQVEGTDVKDHIFNFKNRI
jgi:hypothetical protein